MKISVKDLIGDRSPFEKPISPCEEIFTRQNFYKYVETLCHFNIFINHWNCQTALILKVIFTNIQQWTLAQENFNIITALKKARLNIQRAHMQSLQIKNSI